MIRALLWPPMLALQIILYILGWILVPIAAACRAYDKTYDFGKEMKGENPIVYHFTWPFMYVWDNWEDGIANDMYYKSRFMLIQIIYWSCSRNPINNLRSVRYLSCKINPDKVRFRGTFGDSKPVEMFHKDYKEFNELYGDRHWIDYERQIRQYDTKVPHWFFAWCGLYSNLYWQFDLFGKLRRFWIGWKIYPTDIYGVTSYRKNGAGFALQLKVVK